MASVTVFDGFAIVYKDGLNCSLFLTRFRIKNRLTVKIKPDNKLFPYTNFVGHKNISNKLHLNC